MRQPVSGDAWTATGPSQGAPAARQRLAQHRLLEPQLGLGAVVLVGAAAAARHVRAGRGAPVGRRARAPRRARPRPSRRAPRVMRARTRSPGVRPRHEHDPALEPRQPAAAEDALLDRGLDERARQQAVPAHAAPPASRWNRLSRGSAWASSRRRARDSRRSVSTTRAGMRWRQRSSPASISASSSATRSCPASAASASTSRLSRSESQAVTSSSEPASARSSSSRAIASASSRARGPSSRARRRSCAKPRERPRGVEARLAPEREGAPPALGRRVHLGRAVGEAPDLALAVPAVRVGVERVADAAQHDPQRQPGEPPLADESSTPRSRGRAGRRGARRSTPRPSGSSPPPGRALTRRSPRAAPGCAPRSGAARRASAPGRPPRSTGSRRPASPAKPPVATTRAGSPSSARMRPIRPSHIAA